jgi:bleomycin hydrolase
MRHSILFILFSGFSFSSFSQLHIVGDHIMESPTAVSCTPVKDQYISSTCWSFASNSFIESELLRMGKKEIDLSEMYIARLSYLQKVLTHIRQKGGNYFTPGGQFHDVQWVLKNYGMVPEKAYTGRVRGEANHNHSTLDTLIKEYVSGIVASGDTTPDEKEMLHINELLDRYLGALPEKFTYQDNTFSAKEFLTRELRFNPDDYIEITSYSHHPWYKPYILENKYNWSSAAYMNVPLEDFIRITDEALGKGYSVLWNGDVIEPGFNFTQGWAELPGVYPDLSKERQRTFADSSSYMDHMMHIVGKTKDNKGQPWYYIKNSWGNTGNSEGGFIYMDKNYFAIKTAAIVVHKQAIPADIRRKLGL